MPGHLQGKVAIVTGGAGGVGTHISTIFAEQGAKVVVADTGADVEGRMGMDPTRVNAVVDQIKAAGVDLDLDAVTFAVVASDLITAVVNLDARDRPALLAGQCQNRIARLPVGNGYAAIVIGKCRSRR